jgi:hypothetical protein
MGIAMSVSGVFGSGFGGNYPRRRHEQAPASAEGSGNISQAQKALSALAGNPPSGSQSQDGHGLGVQIKTDFSVLSSAVQSGDATGAQDAAARSMKSGSPNTGAQTSSTGTASTTAAIAKYLETLNLAV